MRSLVMRSGWVALLAILVACVDDTEERGGGDSPAAGAGGESSAGAGGESGAGSGSVEAPIATDDVATTARGVVMLIDVRRNDGPGAVIESFTAASKGAVSLTPDGLFRYAPHEGADGSDSFAYTLVGGKTATVGVTIRPRQGTVIGGQLYTAIESPLPLDATEKEREIGFYWMDANGKGEAVGQFGAAAGARMILRRADGSFVTIPKPQGIPSDSAQWGPLGMNDVGDVVGFSFDADFISSAGWIWNEAAGGKSFAAEALAMRTLSDITDDGVMIGYIEDYDAGLDWKLFTRSKSDDGSEALHQPDGFRHVPGYRINKKRVVVGNAGNGGDGFSAPLRCYLADLASTPTSFDVRSNPDGVYSLDCRALDDEGRIGGKAYLTDSSFQRAFLWDDSGFHVVSIPFPSRVGDIRRGEEIVAIAGDGTLFGQILDLAGSFRAVELTPVPKEEGTSFEPSSDRVAAFEGL